MTSEATVNVNGIPAQVVNRSFFAEDVPLAPGANELVATAVDAAGNLRESSVSVTYETAPAARVRIVSGNLQSGVIGTQLPQPLVVELLDAAGQTAVGKPVFFRLAGNDGALDGGRRRLAVVSGAAGRAQCHFTLGGRAGIANQVVEASAAGFAGPAVFTASAQPGAPELIVVDSGGLQVGVAGRRVPRPLIAAVVDSGHNRLEGVPVLLEVVKGQGTFADGSRSTVLATDSDGRAIVTFRLDPEEGVANNVVAARLQDSEDGPAATFVASGRAAGDPATTSISGVVLDNTSMPIEGVTARIKDTALTAVTDAEGQFRIDSAPVGSVKLIIDGSTADRPGSWPHLDFDLVTIPGRDNTVNMPIYLLPLDLANGLYVDEIDGGSLTLPDVPGFALEVAPGSVTFPGGGRSGLVSVTVVHSDRVPMVPNFGQQPRLIVTIQPAGARFEPPARLTLPNVEGLAPGEVTEMYSFDHDLGHFVSIGPATVSEDGIVMRSDAGIGIVKAGWHCGGNPSGAGTPHACPQCQVCNGSTCVPGCPAEANVGTSGLRLESPFSKGSCGCDDGDVCTVNDRCADTGCIGDPIKILAVSATVDGEKNAAIPTKEETLFEAFVVQENCPSVDYEWHVEPLSPGGEQLERSGQSFTHTFTTPGIYSATVTARCQECESKTDATGVVVYAIEIDLEQEGPTTISTDGKYSEDTTIRATARRSDTGAQLFDFEGTVEIADVSGFDIYQKNGGDLPSNVTISFSGTTTFVAKSLVGPVGSAPPASAEISTTNYPIFGGQPLEVKQWIDLQTIDPERAVGPVYDWLESRLKDIYDSAGTTGPIFGALSTVSTYTVKDLGPRDFAQVVMSHSSDHLMEVNPFYSSVARLDRPVFLPCANTATSKGLTNAVLHEARHGWQDFLTTVNDLGHDDLPSRPNNDDDQDFLVEDIRPCPCIFVIDSTVARQVCNQSNNSVFFASYSGDSVSDNEGAIPHFFFPHEMDAHHFAASNTQ